MKQIAIDRDQYSGSGGQERHQNIVSHRALEKMGRVVFFYLVFICSCAGATRDFYYLERGGLI